MPCGCARRHSWREGFTTARLERDSVKRPRPPPDIRPPPSGGHTPFGRHKEADLEALIVAATSEALDHAGIGADEVDAVWLGHLGGGFVPAIFTSSLVHQAGPALRWRPATRVENACASGARGGRTALRPGQSVLANSQNRRDFPMSFPRKRESSVFLGSRFRGNDDGSPASRRIYEAHTRNRSWNEQLARIAKIVPLENELTAPPAGSSITTPTHGFPHPSP